MRKSDVICPACGAGYRRIELATRPGKRGEFRCLVCDNVLELFDGSREVAIRLTVQPTKLRDNGDKRFSN
jgi:transposase-like protein